MTYILQTSELSKKYKQSTVVDRVSIHVKPGEVYGFMGKNGAGKTTTIRMILNLIKASDGSVQLFGERVNDKNIYRHLRKIGAIIETPGFYHNLTAKENLDIHRIMMNVTDKSSIERALKTVGLMGEEKKKVHQYSLGMKQRLGLARALLHEPELLILDEPTNGLDPQGIVEIRDMLINIAKQGKTVFISSHILSEMEKMVNRMGILHNGKLLEETTKEDFEKKCEKILLLSVSKPETGISLIKEYMSIQDISLSENCISIKQVTDKSSSEITRLLIEHGIEVSESKLVRSSLEDYFMLLTGGESS